ncbi:mycofactocin biosynthesis glycosyltransferase MftF [Nocardioides jiangxiensis]|uniref:Mycofactocin biosynthesis glycosyltransferase MftF n=1 Tax=Nocardioides jiangxiensis TaxID=3064524 RepID=A0ABT9B0U7_9ACTN|nr:mycofactocin biosynthesis glycosyltransferase MftF [Nocardioides sp. WY-20]MDO7868481.1 mycofactocin biosynthesis glycosyltransferase MftF [Nocardioides sp. WY-20]
MSATAERLPAGSDRALAPGTRVRLLPETWRGEGGRALFGGSPTRMLFLTPAACAVLGEGEFAVEDRRSERLARMLLDRGFAEIAAARARWTAADVTVVVPVKDRPVALARLLDALGVGGGLRVIVVDDGSADLAATIEVTRRPGVSLLCHDTSRGPAAARNTGLRAVTTDLVAFADSDVVPVPGWLEPLLAQLEDPAVGVTAPRIAGLQGHDRGGVVARYEAVRSSLDLGPLAAVVRPGAKVPYVPSACLLGRVAAFGDGFDERMHVGEDVDLVWRTVGCGWLVRYVPDAVVAHDHRVDARRWFLRKAFYGTSAAPLAMRHGDAVAPVVLGPMTLAVALAVVAQRRWSTGLAVAVVGAVTARTALSLEQSTRPWAVAARLAPYGLVASLQQSSAAMTRHWWPAMVPLALASRRARRAWLTAAVLEGLVDWRRSRSDLDPLTHVVLRRLDDLAYGAGLWWGALRHATTAPLRPARGRSFLALRRGPGRRGGEGGRRWPGTWRRGTGTHRP